MRKSDTISLLILIVLIPVTILLVSFSATFRLPATYNFYFTDTRAVSSLGYDIEDADVTSEICSYLSNPKDDTFQVYEKVGGYKDEVFGKKDQQAMRHARSFLTHVTVAAILCLIASIVLFAVSVKRAADDRDFFLFWMRCTAGVSAAVIALQDLLSLSKGVRRLFYHAVFQTKLPKDSMLYILIHAGFAKTFCVMTTLIGVVLLCVVLYFWYRNYRPHGRIFY